MTPTTIDDEYSHCIVAESDYQAAVSAIAATFEETLKKNENNENQQLDNVSLQFLKDTQESLVTNLTRIIQSVSDEEYQQTVDQYHVYPEEFLEEESSEEEEEEEEEIDEEDLLDKKAYETAKLKREQVRAVAGRIQQLRHQVLERVAETAVEHFQFPQAAEEKIEIQCDFDDQEDSSAEKLQLSLQKLNQALEQTNKSSLQDQQHRLHETIETIRNDQNKTLSQVESAIVSRTNSWADEDFKQEYQRLSQQDTFAPTTGNTHSTAEESSSMSPQERLALFLND